MVWFQKFEYAMGHWLQKTAEHVLGSVLCSPGCFSLYRAAALMDDNVMKTYTSKSTEAIHYVRNDQGRGDAVMLLFDWGDQSHIYLAKWVHLKEMWVFRRIF